ncbi:hypothetical protein DFJ74DRAFT_690127 [Hyaloraphidium curvatum]|nr:hypothetical protein DFJ74DRAFT_690127 [Hyaloraphidium curvatum]
MLASMVPCIVRLDAPATTDGRRPDIYPAILHALRAIGPVRCVFAPPASLQDSDPEWPLLRLPDVFRALSVEWERVVVFDPPPGEAGGEGFVAQQDLEWMGAGIAGRGVRAEAFRRTPAASGIVESPMTDLEARTLSALVSVTISGPAEDAVAVERFTHAQLSQLSEDLQRSLFSGIRATAEGKVPRLALLTSLSPSLVSPPSFLLLLLPPEAVVDGLTFSWTMIAVDDGDRGPVHAAVLAVPEGTPEDPEGFVAEALTAAGVGRMIRKTSSL